MSIIHIKKREHPYVQIDKRCLSDERLSWRARGILAYLLSKPDNWTVQVKDIENHGLEGRDAVQNALKELQKLGYASLETMQDEHGRLLGKKWVVKEEPTNGFSGNWLNTDELKNRPTEKPFNGKSAPTNNELNTENEFQEEKKDASLFSSSPENENQTLEAEKKETPPPSCAASPPLLPPFTPTGETIEPKPATVVRLYENDLSGVTAVEPSPSPEYQTNPRETQPAEFRRVNIQEEIERLKTDAAAKETFALVRKIPSKYFLEYVEAFGREIGGTGETYPKTLAFRKHFFNWSSTKWEIEQRKTQKQTGKNGSHITHAGGDLSKYNEKQIF